MIRDPSDGSVREGCIPCEAGENPHSDGVHRSLGHETECVADRFEPGSVRDEVQFPDWDAKLKERFPGGVTPARTPLLDKLTSGLPLESTKAESKARLEKSRAWLEQYRKAAVDVNRMNYKGEIPK